MVTVTCSENFGSNTVTVSGQATTWTKVAGPSAGSSNPAWFIFAGAVTQSGKTVKVSGMLGGLNCAAQEWSGLSTTVDASATTFAFATSVSVGPVSASGGDLLLAVMGNASGGRGTPSSSPWIALNNSTNSITDDPIYQVAAQSGMFTATDGFIGMHTVGAAMVALKPGG